MSYWILNYRRPYYALYIGKHNYELNAMGLTSRGKPPVDFKMAEGKKILRYKHLYRNCIHTKTGIILKKNGSGINIKFN